jgi:PPP family 3-phenylpropionic acid transporter
LAFFTVRSFEAMLIAMALLAFFWSAALPLVETVTFDHLREDPARYSRIRLWGSIGFIVAVMGTGAVLDSLPLPSLLWVIVGTLIGILIYALAVPEAPSQHLARRAPAGGNDLAPDACQGVVCCLLRDVGGARCAVCLLLDPPRGSPLQHVSGR